MTGDALLDELGREAIEAAIGSAVDAREDRWCGYLDAELSEDEDDPDWAAEELHQWRLVELRKAGAFLVALVDADFWLSHPTEDTTGRAIALELAFVLERDGVKWSVPVSEPVFTGWDREELAPALSYVVEHHAGQTRKGTAIPYVSHVLAVASLAMEMAPGAPEEAIGALMHDVVEDSGGPADRAVQQRHRRGPEAALAPAQGAIPGRDGGQGARRAARLARRQAAQRSGDPARPSHERRGRVVAVQRRP